MLCKIGPCLLDDVSVARNAQPLRSHVLFNRSTGDAVRNYTSDRRITREDWQVGHWLLCASQPSRLNDALHFSRWFSDRARLYLVELRSALQLSLIAMLRPRAKTCLRQRANTRSERWYRRAGL
jgi:hypothetical protein